jgi:hypothetical protein
MQKAKPHVIDLDFGVESIDTDPSRESATSLSSALSSSCWTAKKDCKETEHGDTRTEFVKSLVQNRIENSVGPRKGVNGRQVGNEFRFWRTPPQVKDSLPSEKGNDVTDQIRSKFKYRHHFEIGWRLKAYAARQPCENLASQPKCCLRSQPLVPVAILSHNLLHSPNCSVFGQASL